MTDNLADARAKAAGMFMYFSEVLKKDVQDADGKLVGNVWDISLKLGEIYPKTDFLIIRKGIFKPVYTVLPWSDISRIDDEIMLKTKNEDIKFTAAFKDLEFLVKRDILDQQVVDTYNHKVRRVNDVHLLKVDHEYVVAHVDTGLLGLVRRLGWENALSSVFTAFNKNSDYLKKKELISWKYIQPVSLNPASMTMKLTVSKKQMSSIPAVDLGEIIFDLNTNQRMALFRTLDVITKARVFENLSFDEQRVILKELDKKEAAQIVTHMSSDEATDLLERLPANTVKNLLTLIESNRAKKLSTLLGYSSDSAGGLMTTEFVSMPEMTAVDAAIDHIKKNTVHLEVVPYIYIVDDKNRLKGVTTIRRLLFADPKDDILKTAFSKTLYVYLNNSVKEVAYFMDRYKVSAIPVLDENRIMHGIITMDDILSQVISIAWRKRGRVPKRFVTGYEQH